MCIRDRPFAPWWLVVNSDAWFPPGSLARMAKAASRGALTLSGGAPPWCCFALGDQAVATVGLFDEGIYPAYFEDNDYERRCEHHGVPVVRTDVPVAHDNSSTIGEPRYAARNSETFAANAAYYGDKVARNDMTPGQWSLAIRRILSWD